MLDKLLLLDGKTKEIKSVVQISGFIHTLQEQVHLEDICMLLVEMKSIYD